VLDRPVHHLPNGPSIQTSARIQRRSHALRLPPAQALFGWAKESTSSQQVADAEPDVPTVMGPPKDFGSYMTQGLRDGMEDELKLYYDETHQHLYCGVFDGHGGSAAAQWLSRELHNVLNSHLQKDNSKPLTASLSDAFEDADKQLLAYLETQGTDILQNAGSTGTVALVRTDRVVLANVGDSQGFLLRKGQPFALATPHRVYGQGDFVKTEIERVRSTGGWIHDGRVCNILAVSRAFGDWEFKGVGLSGLLQAGVERGYWPPEFAQGQSFKSDPVIVTPDASDTRLTEDDELLVVATDGMWDVLPPLEALRWARKEFKARRNAQEVAESLVALALKRYTTDNVACIVVDLKGQEHWNPTRNGRMSKPLLGGFFGSKK